MKHYRDGGIYTADMGQPPQDIDGGSAPLKKRAPKILMPKGLSPKQSEAARNEAKKHFSEMPLSPKQSAAERDEAKKRIRSEIIKGTTGKNKASFRKGGSIDGLAQRGKTNCKMR